MSSILCGDFRKIEMFISKERNTKKLNNFEISPESSKILYFSLKSTIFCYVEKREERSRKSNILILVVISSAWCADVSQLTGPARTSHWRTARATARRVR